MLRIHGIQLDIDEKIEIIPNKILGKLRLEKKAIQKWQICKESIDARHKGNIKRVYSVDFSVENEESLLKKRADLKLERTPDSNYSYVEKGTKELKSRPVVVGFGPCGMFAGLILSQMGYKPLILERGKEIEQRIKDVDRFWKEGTLDGESNVQFGEGGAGTFSDGKLNTGIKDFRIRKILTELAAAGAPEDILYKQKPHIGTDVLRKVVRSVRRTIEANGGEIKFQSRMTGIEIIEGKICAVEINNNEWINTEALILSIGHSARDTFELLYKEGIQMEQKSFSIGARIEHSQEAINISQYGNNETADVLGAAEYKLSYHCTDGRGVYTFCMCPGGYVVGSASETGGVVTNGMSYHGRDGKNANSALLVSVEPKDFSSEHPLSGIELQRKYEKAAFELGGSNYYAPAQKVGDFLAGKSSQEQGAIEPEYKPGVKWTDLSGCLPDFVIKAMKEAIPNMGKKIRGFDGAEAVLTGVETRSSSPVRIIRNDDFQSNISGVFPAGEGAGYAGGIISAAVDGIKAAEAVAKIYR